MNKRTKTDKAGHSQAPGGHGDDSAHHSFDGLFKHSMSVPANAKDFFSLFIASNIWALVDKHHMELCPQSMVDNKLKHKHVDVLYRTKFEGAVGYIYLLTEQQTRPDKAMPYRMVQYVMRGC